MTAPTASRRENYVKLCGHHDIEKKFDDLKRFASVSHAGDEYFVSTFANVEEAFKDMGWGVLEGLDPDAAYDLDTGERIGVAVAPPVVRRAEDPSGENVLGSGS